MEKFSSITRQHSKKRRNKHSLSGIRTRNIQYFHILERQRNTAISKKKKGGRSTDRSNLRLTLMLFLFVYDSQTLCLGRTENFPLRATDESTKSLFRPGVVPCVGDQTSVKPLLTKNNKYSPSEIRTHDIYINGWITVSRMLEIAARWIVNRSIRGPIPIMATVFHWLKPNKNFSIHYS
jgi:hypothetical protein